MSPDLQQIVTPSAEYQRTENLWRLYEAVSANPGYPLDESLKSFLREYITRDFQQAALIGLILLRLGLVEPLSAYARMFCALGLNHEPELKQAVIRAMSARSPGDVYDELADITVYGDPKSATYHYAYLVLANVDADSLKDSFEDY